MSRKIGILRTADAHFPAGAWFTKGFDIADLKDAKVLLAELRKELKPAKLAQVYCWQVIKDRTMLAVACGRLAQNEPRATRSTQRHQPVLPLNIV